MSKVRYGIQLFSVRDQITDADSLRRAMQRLAEIGYEGVEFYDYAGMSAGALREALEACGLRAVNSHVHFQKWLDNPDAEIAYAKEAGIGVVTFPWLPPDARTPEMYGRILRLLPELVRKAEAAGLRMGYHNHDFEYGEYEGQPLLGQILAVPGLLLELDTFWCKYAGRDPVAEMGAYREHLGPVHIKDYKVLDTPLAFEAIGEGVMENGAVVDCARRLGVEWVVVEQDNSRIDTFESAAISLKNLKLL